MSGAEEAPAEGLGEPQANEIRGEVDLELEGERFVLRPSYTALVEIEKATGKGLIQLASEASDGELTLGHAAVIVTLLIQAWGKATGNGRVQAVCAERIGELLYEFGLMKVNLRLAYVLGLAATGGCRADGTPREGEAMAAGTMTTATPAADSPA
ncbi:MAG TPA: GTA-gp10 family protein [Allosphingosinicella sp.]|jgi:hypothetical protein